MTNASMRTAKHDSAQSTQYSVYAFHPNKYSVGMPQWRKVGATSDMKRAMKHAKLLNKKHKYQKIEVKKRFFCKYEKKIVGKTVRIYEPNFLSWQDLMRTFNVNKNN